MSRLVLDRSSLKSLLVFFLKDSAIKTFDVKVNEINKLYFKIIDVELDSWMMDKIANNTELDLEVKIKDNRLRISIDLYGVLLTFIQNMPLIDNIIFLFCPKMKTIKGVKVIDLKEIEIDLNAFCKNININDIIMNEGELRTLVVDFSIR